MAEAAPKPPHGAFVVTGTGTGIGKTVFAAALAQALGAFYWKPVQAGLEPETDSQTVRRLGGLPAERMLPEAHALKLPASPHLAAETEGARIAPHTLDVPQVEGPLVIEGAGGLMVPLDRQTLYIDLFARWGLPVVLCAATGLGSINHTLLSIEALQRRQVPLLGIAFIGPPHPDNEATIPAFGATRRLGRLDHLDEMTPESLRQAFRRGFDTRDFDTQNVGTNA